jgi:hypothetical protein
MTTYLQSWQEEDIKVSMKEKYPGSQELLVNSALM